MAQLHQNKLGITIEGDLADLQIIEEGSDSEDDSGKSQVTSNTLSSIPTDVGSFSNKPVFGAVAVTNSENVHFGDKHIKIYNGPINIKQIVQSSSGIDNGSYQKTEVENVAKPTHQSKESEVPKYVLQTWHKLTCLAVGVVVLCTICAVVILLQNHRHQTSATDTDHFDSNSNSKHEEVMGTYYNHLQFIIVSLAVVQLTTLVLCWLSMCNKQILVKDEFHAVDTGYCSISKCVSYVKGNELLILPNQLRIVSRTDWLAQPVEKPLNKLRQPAPWVIITHTATESCHSQSSCVLAVRLIQTFHIESRKWDDIGYNFLVGGDGSAYYGRGWDYEGAHTKFFNKYSISIAFIGTFNKEVPPKQQLEACRKLIKLGLEEGKLAKDYKLFAHRQLMSTLSPGDVLFDIIKEWPHFVSNYTSDMIPNY